MRQLPDWLKKRVPLNKNVQLTKDLLEKKQVNSVCHNAICPNLGECYAKKVATFLVMGTVCTRNCNFCAVTKGTPEPPQADEPQRLAEVVQDLDLQHVVITSVTRDDLHDGGASHFLNCIKAIRDILPDVIIEILTPDFLGNKKAINTLANTQLNIFNHNLETVPRLYPKVRPQANYQRSISLLAQVKSENSSIYTKSGLMVGLGETFAEIEAVLRDLKEVNCDFVTIGQYLQPSSLHLQVEEYIHPETFKKYQLVGEKMGFKNIAAAPFVRSSYNAQEFFHEYNN